MPLSPLSHYRIRTKPRIHQIQESKSGGSGEEGFCGESRNKSLTFGQCGGVRTFLQKHKNQSLVTSARVGALGIDFKENVPTN